ncbi:MAG: response regulator transcription factor [Thomasclavelia sp.]|nr:response regulator transcription factor [Thomasclavelia sp.]
MTKILIIEDDSSINKIISYSLTKEGYQVDSLLSGKDAVSKITTGDYDLVVVDWMLPVKSGVEIIRECRSQDYIKPLIILTAKSSDEDIVEGLESGADDYLTKPFNNDTLIARINAHLRRYYKHFSGNLNFNNINLDLNKRMVYIDKDEVKLTKVEYDLLRYFIERKEDVVTRDELLNNIWGFGYDGDTRLVDVHVFKLKSKLNAGNIHFKSIRGIGYQLEDKDE